MLKRLFVAAALILAMGVVSGAFAQGISYRAGHKDLALEVMRCAIQPDNSCIVDMLLENRSDEDWNLYPTGHESVVHKNRAYDDAGNSYSKISMAIGNTAKYVYGRVTGYIVFPAGTLLKVRVKIFDVSEIASLIKRIDIDLVSEEWGSGTDSGREPLVIMNIPISR